MTNFQPTPRTIRAGLSSPQGVHREFSGFTLIEVMVVLLIMSIMALLSWQGIQTMLKTREQSLELVSGVDTIQTAVSQWRVDLDNTLSAQPSASVPSLDWDARVLRVVRRSSGPMPTRTPDTSSSSNATSSEASGSPALWVVAWSARNLSTDELTQLPLKERRQGLYWLRWQSPAISSQTELNAYWQMASQWGQNPSAESRAFETVLFEIQNWQLYFYRNNAWTNALSSAGEGVQSIATPQTATPTSTTNSSTANGSGAANGSTSGSTGSTTSNPNNGATSSNMTNTLAVFPDGVRLKLYPAPDKVLGTGVQNTTFGNAQNDPSLTLDWVRLNFTAPKL
jgi:general secretion pathway protein J